MSSHCYFRKIPLLESDDLEMQSTLFDKFDTDLMTWRNHSEMVNK